MASAYRGRLAPSLTGYLNAGHARTFWTAQQRAQSAGGTLLLRLDGLDPSRSRRQGLTPEAIRRNWPAIPNCVASASDRCYPT
jgi:glutamyl/glutaminyl-tRNA synthetase